MTAATVFYSSFLLLSQEIVYLTSFGTKALKEPSDRVSPESK